MGMGLKLFRNRKPKTLRVQRCEGLRCEVKIVGDKNRKGNGWGRGN